MNKTFFVEPTMITWNRRKHIYNILMYTDEPYISVRGVYDSDEDDEIVIIGIAVTNEINKGEMYTFVDKKQYMNELKDIM